jgi:NAD(P)H-dependent FMN reductase
MPNPFIPILLGTARPERRSEKAAKFVYDSLSKRYDADTQLIDIKDYLTPHTFASWQESEQGKRWKEIILKAQGLIIVTPEYNHGYPGELKILLDKLYEEYKRLPVGLCGVSSGNFGGTRVVENLLPVLKELNMIPIHTVIYFSKIKELFDQNGKITDESYNARMETFFDEMLEFTKIFS